MTAAAAAQHAQQAALAKAAYDAAVAQYNIDEALRASSLDMASRRKDCVKCVAPRLTCMAAVARSLRSMWSLP